MTTETKLDLSDEYWMSINELVELNEELGRSFEIPECHAGYMIVACKHSAIKLESEVIGISSSLGWMKLTHIDLLMVFELLYTAKHGGGKAFIEKIDSAFCGLWRKSRGTLLAAWGAFKRYKKIFYKDLLATGKDLPSAEDIMRAVCKKSESLAKQEDLHKDAINKMLNDAGSSICAWKPGEPLEGE